MSRDNPTWGRRRIRSELHLLGYELGELTVAKYVVRGRKPPSQGWRVFLANHAREIAAIDFFTAPTVNFRILICFLVLREYFAYYHDSRSHQALDRNAPRPRKIEPPSQGRIVAEPQVGGLHHRYRRAA